MMHNYEKKSAMRNKEAQKGSQKAANVNHSPAGKNASEKVRRSNF